MQIFSHRIAVLSCNSGDFPDRNTAFIKGLYLFDQLSTFTFRFRQVIHSRYDFFYPPPSLERKNRYPFPVELRVYHS